MSLQGFVSNFYKSPNKFMKHSILLWYCLSCKNKTFR